MKTSFKPGCAEKMMSSVAGNQEKSIIRKTYTHLSMEGEN